MSLGRRKVGIDEASRWVFNRMADVYDARPPYPPALLDAIGDLARKATGTQTARILDLGAGIGHVALPLAASGFDVVAIEPAQLMLDRLRATANARGLGLRAVHAPAEALPIADASVDLVVVADALHFLDAQRTAEEVARVLTRRGALAVVTCAFAATPFMRDVLRVIESAVPRRPRALAGQMIHLSSTAQVPLTSELHFDDQTPVDHATLERILRSISFIGPAMNPGRFAQFWARVRALSDAPVWARTFVLRSGGRDPARSDPSRPGQGVSLRIS